MNRTASTLVVYGLPGIRSKCMGVGTARFQFPRGGAPDMSAPRLILDAGVQEFDGLDALPFRMDNVHVMPHATALEAYKATVIARVRAMYTMEALKDVPELRAYRDFFWRVGN